MSDNAQTVKSRGYFIQRIVYPWELPSIMRKHTLTGAMGGIWLNLASGMFFVYFGTRIGLTPVQWGIMAGLSSWLIALQPLAAAAATRAGRRKAIWFWFAMLERSLRFLGIIAAFFLWKQGSPGAGAVLMLAIVAANLFGAMANPPWLSWLADIIPQEQHGSFWGKRASWVAAAVILSIVPAGLFMDLVSEANKLSAVVGVFAAATFIGVLDLLIHGTIPEPEMIRPGSKHLLQQFRAPLRDSEFRPWLLFNFCWTFSMTLGGSLATLYFVNDLGIKNSFLGGAIVLTSLGLLGGVLSGRSSGRLVDRAGVRRVLFAAHCVWSLLPLFWFFARPAAALWFLGLGSLVGGAASTAGSTAANKLVTRIPPAPVRTMYIAVSTSLGSIAGGLGPIVAGSILHFVSDATIGLGGLELGGFHLIFFASFGLRSLTTLLLARRIRDVGS